MSSQSSQSSSTPLELPPTPAPGAAGPAQNPEAGATDGRAMDGTVSLPVHRSTIPIDESLVGSTLTPDASVLLRIQVRLPGPRKPGLAPDPNSASGRRRARRAARVAAQSRERAAPGASTP